MVDVLLLRGAPGAGKSTAAAVLSRLLGGPPALVVLSYGRTAAEVAAAVREAAGW